MELTTGIDLSTNFLENIDKNLSSEEFKTRAFQYFEDIVKKEFVGYPGKQKIHLHTDRITGSCPYCRDSMQSEYKHRGNIILSGKFAGYYKCFNCGVFRSVSSFFKDYKIDLQLDFINYLSSTKSDFKRSSYGSYDISILMDVQTIEKYAIDRQELKNEFNFIEVIESSILPWLKRRLQYDNERFLFNISENYLAILNLTAEGKILGFQRRNFNRGWEKYMTYNLRKIYQLMNKKEEILEEVDILSLLYKITEVNFNRPIMLLEGPLDSFLIKNSIANSGANKNFPIDIPLKYLYDKDITGIKKSIEHINNGEEVFLWEKYLRDVNAPFRKKWDITDIFMWAKENNIRLPDILNYFSKEPLDIVDI